MIIGLDLGQHIGWVKGNAVGPMASGTFEMDNTTDLGRWLQSSDPFFRQQLNGVTGIAVEQPFMGTDYFAARKLIALLGHMHYWRRIHGLPSNAVSEIAVSTGKKALSGRGNATAEQMIAAAAGHGHLGMDEHQAHALGIWWVYVFGRAEDPPKPRTRSSKGVIIPPPAGGN